jgi:hypothetical protein
MSRTRWLAVVSISVATIPGTHAAAQTPTVQTPEVVVEGKLRDDLKKVCKTQVTTGSIMPTRTCKSKGEWEQIRQRSLAQLEQIKKDQDTQRMIEESRRNR